MPAGLDELPGDIREVTVTALRLRRPKLVRDLSNGLSTEPGFENVNLADLAGILITVLAAAVKSGWVDAKTASLPDLLRFTPPLSVRHLIRAVHHAERTALGELSLEDGIGASADSWQIASSAIRTAAIEISGVIAEFHDATHALRDPLTTLLSPALFDFLISQETVRARRHRHGVAMILFDVDDLADLNRRYGHNAGDWLLERLGILARQFFRIHDSVARHGGDSVAVLLPETPMDQASSLARQFCAMVRSRLVLIEHKTDATAQVTVSAAAVGTDLVSREFDHRVILTEAEAAIVRAQMNGGGRIETVALLPTSVTIAGAATLLGVTTREVTRLLRGGALRATRRGRHLHIEREHIDAYRHRT
jgi:diguanylate cyclase (GGDEF)-like protein/excisionase family DNA binding protein